MTTIASTDENRSVRGKTKQFLFSTTETGFYATLHHLAKIVLIALVVSVSFVLVCTTATPSYAETDEELSQRVEQTSADYNAAVAAQQEIQSEIDELEQKISELQNQLPQRLDETKTAACEIYESNNSDEMGTLLSLLLNADSVDSILTASIAYEKILNQRAEALMATETALTEIQESRDKLEDDKIAADEAVAAAETAMEEAKSARDAAQRAQKARAASDTMSEQSADLVDDVNWNMSRDEFIAEWTSRIDAYLAGSATAGCGVYYATAAWDYGVDPRWAPAISLVESTKGAVCFRSHNAWGFGGSGYSSWEEGINAVVKALGGSLYGGNLTYKAASTYCPPNASHWYNTCYSEMKKI